MCNDVEDVQLLRHGGVNGQFGYIILVLGQLKPKMNRNVFHGLRSFIMACP